MFLINDNGAISSEYCLRNLYVLGSLVIDIVRHRQVCVPAAPALCLRAPCAPIGECRRVSGRRVEPPALPAPPSCWPGSRSAQLPAGCARASLQLARERLARGAHVERACAALRRALAAALAARAPPAPPLALLCDLAPDDDDALDLALVSTENKTIVLI